MWTDKTRCSYRFVQQFRRYFIHATIKYLLEVKFDHKFIPEDEWKDWFIACPNDVNDGKVDYEEQESDINKDKQNLIDQLNFSIMQSPT